MSIDYVIAFIITVVGASTPILLAGLGELAGRLLTEAQSDPVGLGGCHLPPHAQGIVFQTTPRFFPGLAPVNVRAITQMDAMMKLHSAISGE